MKNKWRMPHPATLFFLLTLGIVFCSWICEIYGLKVVLPNTGQELRVQSLLSPEGIRWWLRHSISNFTSFSPLGMVIIALFGLGVAQHSGLINACIRRGIGEKGNPKAIIIGVIFLGLLSNAVGDGGYILLLPIAAVLFQWVGLHPIAGIITAYVSVACGYSANIFLSTMDPLLANLTQEAALEEIGYQGNTEPLCNYFFMSASTFVLAGVIYVITRRWLLPSMGEYQGEVRVEGYKQLSRKERRALIISLVVLGLYTALILFLTFSSYGILRGVNGGIMHSPFIAGILFLISLGIGITGLTYGIYSGRYHRDSEIVEGFVQPIKMLASFFIIAFFAAQMFACFDYSHLDKYIAVVAVNWFASFNFSILPELIVFILVVTLVNLIMVSATGKWGFMAFIFIPLFAEKGITPEVVQCAFRIGDSATNAITPFLFYMPLVLVYMQQYTKRVSYGTLFKYTWRYSLAILVVWTLLFMLWFVLKWPVGL